MGTINFCLSQLVELLSAFGAFFQEGPPWYMDPDALTALASVGALVISLAALAISQHSSTQQVLREKREELRGACEKLISLREEFNEKFSKFKDPNERNNYNAFFNSKRAIYLEAAEALIKQIPGKASAYEYCIVANENFLESDFVEARKYYEKAVNVSSKSSLTTKAHVLKSLGSIYYIKEFQNIPEGQKYFERALKVFDERLDYYSLSYQTVILRDWANQELTAGEMVKAGEILDRALLCVNQVPDDSIYKYTDRFQIAMLWRYIGNRYFNGIYNNVDELPQRAEKARAAYKKGLEIIQSFFDNDSILLRGQIYFDWATNEHKFGDQQRGEQLRELSKTTFLSLPQDFSLRADWIKYIENMLQAIQQVPQLDESPTVSSEVSGKPGTLLNTIGPENPDQSLAQR